MCKWQYKCLVGRQGEMKKEQTTIRLPGELKEKLQQEANQSYLFTSGLSVRPTR